MACRCLMALGIGMVTFAGSARERDDAGGTAVVLGVGGTHRTGEWTSVTVRMPTPVSGAIRVAVEDPDGQFVASPPVTVSEDGRIAHASVRPGRPHVQVRVFSEENAHDATGALVASVDVPAAQTTPSTTPLLLVIGRLPAAPSAARLVAGDGIAMQVIPLEASTPAGATSSRDLEAFDSAIVCGTAVEGFDAATLEAIDGWVRGGGQLVFAAGASAMAIAQGGGPSAGWLPSSDPRLVPLRSAGAVEAFARASGLAARMPPTGLMVPQFESPSGVVGIVDVFEGASATDLPLVVRRAHGFGTITWIGLDMDEPWCRTWPGCDRLLAALLGGRSDTDLVVPAVSDTSRRVRDLASQLRVSLDTFAADGKHAPSQPVPFEIIAAVAIAYCLTLYPLDWWLVRWSGRPWLSWLTLPVAAGGFAAMAWGLGLAWGRDAEPRARAASITDFDAVSQLVRGSAWAAVRSPSNGAIDIGLAAGSDTPIAKCDAAVSWFADRGTGFGGVDAAVAHPSLATSDYEYGRSLSELRGVPIAAASSRLFEAGWTGQARGTIAESSLMRDTRGLLAGRVTSKLPFAIEQCSLVHGGWIYDVGRIEPGDTFDTGASRGPRSLAAALTRRAAVGDRDQTVRWDAGSTDVIRILEIAGLHAAAGAESYTGLTGGRLGGLDRSSLLAVDRAILVGTVASKPLVSWDIRLSGATMTANLEVEQAAASVVRVIVPVRTAPVVKEASP